MIAHERVNILLVDDQPAKLLSYEVILAELGDNLIKANSAREALEVLLKNDVAVVLVDVCMPELDGFELASMLRQHPRYEKTAIIFISAIHLSDLDRVRGYETGAVDYVPVPVVPEILRAKVKIFAELWRKTRQLERLNGELERRVRERTAELEASTARLSETAEHLRLASEAAGFGTYDYHASAGHVYWSAYLRQLVGIQGDDPLTLERALHFIHADHRDMVRQHMESYIPNSGRREIEFKVVRPDGETRWLLDRGQALADKDRKGFHVMGTVLDITERKHNEERQRLLMAELDHRVKNILGNVSAVAQLSKNSAQSVEDFVKSLEGRIQAISRAHGLLRRGSWASANLAELASEALSPFRSSSNVDVEGDPVCVVPELAQSLALILHELATNAIKYGALSVPEGRVRVRWSSISPAQLRFSWQESGGPQASLPIDKGFGLTVLETAALDLGAVANYDFGKEGFVYTLQGPFELAPPTAEVLPFAGAAHKVQSSKTETSAKENPKAARILVVEDEALVALQVQGDLQQAGFHVIGPARSLKHGLLLATQEEFDAALVDISLGRDTSAAIADQLLARSIPFVFATGYSEASMLPKHLREIRRLKKPYVAAEMQEILSDLMAQVRHRPKEFSVGSD
jgi:PAS domain S-box-containing protein